MTNSSSNIRLDHKIILDLVEPNSRVLDLGCGDGELLSLLIEKRRCKATGIEIDEKAIYNCMKRGLTISHGDIDSELADYATKKFDYVILNESLQEVLYPQKVILESLRVGKKAIVGIPNFCHVSARLQIFFGGRVPITHELPYEWYNTPNLRFLSLKDFRRFCVQECIRILNERPITLLGEIHFMPNLFARIGIYLLEKN